MKIGKREKKGLVAALLAVFFLTGCGTSSADYDPVIETVIEENAAFCEQYAKRIEEKEDHYTIVREEWNFTVYEDENNYYVLACSNDNDMEGIHGDGYKVGKNNDRASTTMDDRAAVVEFWESNVEPVYTEENIRLVEEFTSSDMR